MALGFFSFVVLAGLFGVASSGDSNGRWAKEKATEWYSKQPWLVGCNFIPSTAINELEMWQADTFDPATIDRELGWAHGIGMNCVRVFLHDLAWKQDKEGFKKRIDEYLKIAEKHHIKTMLVLFDSCWNAEPHIGKQPEPKVGVHNSGWLQCPGEKSELDPTTWPELEQYVHDIVRTFGHDHRVFIWDVYNEPRAAALPLLKEAFKWVRAAKPSQPITSGAFWADEGVAEWQLENCDISSFHNYDVPEELIKRMDQVAGAGRPIICTEWMARTRGSKVDSCLHIFKERKMGCMIWGLVSGKTNTIFPWGSEEGGAEPKLWFHDLFRKDGTPFDANEIEIFPEADRSQVVISALVLASLTIGGTVLANRATTDVTYDEAYRPQFHFSAKKNWLNDPNGLVFFDGQYHLFFQHNPGAIQWGDMHWGHAVSSDLIHWKELEPAIAPDEHGTCYSGSANVDWHNTSGLGEAGKPLLVGMYTGAGKPFVQCLIYSRDKGKTWEKFAGNPVVPHIADENRDPRIFWHEPTHKWVMALYLTNDEYALLGSPDLKSWKELSRLHVPGSSECPELFEMPVEGKKHETKWVFYGGNFRYVVGQFDGTKFTPEQSPLQADFGPNFYASQTYANAPHGRRIQIGWMNGQGPLPGMPFNQQMSIPCDLKLVSTPEGFRIHREPVQELKALRHGHVRGSSLEPVDANRALAGLVADTFDLEMELLMQPGSKATIQFRGVPLVLDAGSGQATWQGAHAPVQLDAGKVEVRILVDRSSVEVFLNGGAASLTGYFQPNLEKHGYSLSSSGGDVRVNKLDAYELSSAWKH